ncbi:hypothetical protein KAU55_07240, partial [Candidatus Bathyarchaeota archaeon]|nr:hypothetical protein [Candidatus Bathyarchaeota archaeon]
VITYGTWSIIITLIYIDMWGTPVTQTITLIFYGTITEDIVGSTFYDDIGIQAYPFKDQLRTPDIKVDIKDVATAAKAFGSYPGHERWSPYPNINDDYQIDIRDIAAIAKEFGWTG